MSDSGISMKFVEGWDIVPDQNPHAFSLLVCPLCLVQFEGVGHTLTESMADAAALRDAHRCSHLEQRTGDETI